MGRLHTALALLFVAAVPLAPLSFWIYARAASVDRGSQVRHAQALLADAAPFPGAHRAVQHVYERRAWNGESLVPIAGYFVETAYALPRAAKPRDVVAHYRRELRGWRASVENRGCRSCAVVTFRRGSDRLELQVAEYTRAKALRGYGVSVSQ